MKNGDLTWEFQVIEYVVGDGVEIRVEAERRIEDRARE